MAFKHVIISDWFGQIQNVLSFSKCAFILNVWFHIQNVLSFSKCAFILNEWFHIQNMLSFSEYAFASGRAFIFKICFIEDFTNVFIFKLSTQTFLDIYNGLFDFTLKNFFIFVWFQSHCIRSKSFTQIYHNLIRKLIINNYVYNKVPRILQPTSI